MDLLCYLSFYPVALGGRRSTLRLYSHCPLMKSVPNEFSILNTFHLSIELALRLYLFVLRLNVVIMNFCMIDCFIVVCLHGGE